MKITIKTLVLVLSSIIFGCNSPSPAVDATGQLPQDVVMETYTFIIESNYDRALENFSEQYIEEFMTSRNITFRQYADRPRKEGWKREWLRTKLVGNKYNRDVWRVEITPDEGKGKGNRATIVHDLYMIDGRWKIVFWGHYPKT